MLRKPSKRELKAAEEKGRLTFDFLKTGKKGKASKRKSRYKRKR